jgi:hypothetical protein
VVVVVGVTVTLVPETAPTPEMLNAVAPITLNARVDVPPLMIVAGLAVKLTMSGTEALLVTVTVVVAVADPALFDAVST